MTVTTQTTECNEGSAKANYSTEYCDGDVFYLYGNLSADTETCGFEDDHVNKYFCDEGYSQRTACQCGNTTNMGTETQP